MKKYLKFIFIIVALFSISFTLNVKAEEEEYRVVIEDDASLLLSVEKVKIKDSEAYSKKNSCFITFNEYSKYSDDKSYITYDF